MPRKLIFILAILVFWIGIYFLFKEIYPKLFMIEGTKIKTKLEAVANKAGEISIITIYDNYQVNTHLKTGWGFSCLVKTKDKNILFDTGADSPTLLSNMEKLNINPKEIDLIVLSHIHGDHVGGLEGFLQKNRNVKVYIPASFPNSMREEIKSHEAEYIDVSEFSEISEGIYSTGELGTWIKEQSLIVNTEKGLILITGCAHPGVVNIVDKVKEMFPEKNVFLVLGGFHLSGTSDSELKGIIKDFRKLGVQKAAPCHCSGDRCRELFKEEYKEDFIENGVGKIIEI